MDLIKQLEKKYLESNKQKVNLKQVKSLIGDVIEIHYKTSGDNKNVRKFQGVLIGKRKKECTWQCRYILLKKFKYSSIKFSFDVYCPQVKEIRLIRKNNIKIKKSKYYFIKKFF